MNLDEVNDFHLNNLKRRILLQDKKVEVEMISMRDTNVLKLFKWNISKKSLLKFNPTVYTIVQKVDKCIGKIFVIDKNIIHYSVTFKKCTA